MKRIIYFIVLISLISALTACSPNEAESGAQSTSQPIASSQEQSSATQSSSVQVEFSDEEKPFILGHIIGIGDYNNWLPPLDILDMYLTNDEMLAMDFFGTNQPTQSYVLKNTWETPMKIYAYSGDNNTRGDLLYETSSPVILLACNDISTTADLEIVVTDVNGNEYSTYPVLIEGTWSPNLGDYAVLLPERQLDENITTEEITLNRGDTLTLELSDPLAFDNLYKLRVVENSVEFSVIYPIGDPSIPNDAYTVVDAFSKTTGEKRGSSTYLGSIIDESLEYNHENNLVRYSLVNGSARALRTLEYTSSIGYDIVPEHLTEKLDVNIYTTFDGTPELASTSPDNAWWAVSSDDGVYLDPIAPNSNQPIFISNSILAEKEEFQIPVDYMQPYFSDVKIMAGGKVLVCNVVIPMAQSGSVALFTYDIATGEQNWYTDVFSAMIAIVDYYYDNTVIARGYNHAVVIELDDNNVSYIPTSDFAFHYTYDYRYFFNARHENGKSYLNIIDSHEGTTSQVLKEFDSEDIYILDITENFAVVALDESTCVSVAYKDGVQNRYYYNP